MIIDEKTVRKLIDIDGNLGVPQGVNESYSAPICLGQYRDMLDTLEKLWTVARAAEKIVRPGPRQSKENAPLEYALWEALSALNEPQSGDAPNDTNAEEEARNAALDEAAKVANGHRHASGNTCLCAFFIRDEIRALKK